MKKDTEPFTSEYYFQVSLTMSIEKPIEGVIRIIDQTSTNSKFVEKIYMGLCIKSTRSQFEIPNWIEDREKFEVITSNFKKNFINKNNWYNNGSVFIVPTKTFEKTKIEIYLKEHVLLGTGFEIELYTQNDIKSISFTNTELISTSLGGTMTTTIEWKITKSETNDAITFKSNEEWSQKIDDHKPKRNKTTSSPVNETQET